jgi:hypothetical protein
MQPSRSETPTWLNQLRRNGPLAVIVVLLVGVGALVLINGGDNSDSSGNGGNGGDQAPAEGLPSWTSVDGVEPGAPAPIGDMPTTRAEAEEVGAHDDHDWPETCDTEQGTLAVPTVYALPCVPESDGNNGATSTGVTDDTIRVVYYNPEQAADLAAVLGGMGVNDSPEDRTETLRDYVEIYSSVAETYGREIEIISYDATGGMDDVVAARADATDIIAMDPFAVIGGPVLDRGTFAQELAGAGVHCYSCGSNLPDDMILDMAPYVWDTEPSTNQRLAMLNAWTSAAYEVLGGDVAAFAGGDLEGQPRRVGVIHFEMDPPIYGQTTAEQMEVQTGADDIVLTETYIFDVSTLPAKAAELIARFKAEDITTIVFLGDPLMPGNLTEQATLQDYHPEWIFTGTALTDTNVMARRWDPAQMERAYGISQLPAPMEQDLQGAIRLYRWYFGEDAMPAAEAQYNLIAPFAQWLVGGVHMAGPDLNPETFALGLFRIPPAGGGPEAPQISFGNWGVFPEMDYHAIDDATEIWWDGDIEVQDERGEVGPGGWRRTNTAERFTIEGAPPPQPFVDADSATVLDEHPDGAEPPDYPPPEGAPTAG